MQMIFVAFLYSRFNDSQCTFQVINRQSTIQILLNKPPNDSCGFANLKQTNKKNPQNALIQIIMHNSFKTFYWL